MTETEQSPPSFAAVFRPYLLPLILLLIALGVAWFVLRPASTDVRSQEIARLHWENNLKSADLQLMSNPTAVRRLDTTLVGMEVNFFERIGQIQMLDQPQSKEVIHYFRSLQTERNLPLANYALGHAYFLDSNYPKAIAFFKKYQTSLAEGSSPFQDVEFFLLLAYIANGSDQLIVDPLLQSIIDNKQHRFHNAARTLKQSIFK